MKKGFTLLELAIVLVIVGLLIGGILVAKSLITAVRVQSFVRQIQQFDVAAQNFYTTYKQIPGDSSLFSVAGDNDSNIEDDLAAGGDGDFLAEFANYWVHLYRSGMLKDSYVAAAASGVVEGVNVPLAKIGKNAGIMVGQPNDAGAPDNISFNGINQYYISEFTGATTDFNTSNAITAADALATDRKMDDGLANSGDIVAQGASTDVSVTPNATAGSGCVLSTGKSRYLVSSTSAYPCSLAIKLSFTQSKDLY